MKKIGVLVMGMALSFLQANEAGTNVLAFKPLEAAKGMQRYRMMTTDEATLNGLKQPLTFMQLMQSGQRDHGEVYGALKDREDKPLKLPNGAPYICNGTSNPYGSGSGLDHVTILQKNGKLFMVSQFECQIGAYYINELQQDSQGTLSPKSETLRFISQKEEFGGYVHCAGMKTPWESHLGSEEYPADAKKLQESGEIDLYYNYVKAYWKEDLSRANPYYYGWIPEIKVDNNGDTSYTKHYSMGRFSHELAYVMPDRKTVYMSDDGTNVGLFMYRAKRAEELSEGTLYAAKCRQTSAAKGGSAALEWIRLGSATDRQIRALIDPDHNTSTNDGLKFEDIFEVGSISNVCQAGFVSINTEAGHECLKVKKGMETAAAFLESRRYAAMLGATTEFRKEEGITFDEKNRTLYVAMSEISRGMEEFSKNGEKDDRYDKGGNNDIRLPYNPCGGVYALNVDETYTATHMRAVLVGKMTEDKGCDLNGIANPDNLSFLQNSHLLAIGEDSSYRENNMVWTYDVKNNQLTRIISLPKGAEATSPFWYPDINGYGYLLLVTQHPDSDTEQKGESSVGVLGAIKGL